MWVFGGTFFYFKPFNTPFLGSSKKRLMILGGKGAREGGYGEHADKQKRERGERVCALGDRANPVATPKNVN